MSRVLLVVLALGLLGCSSDPGTVDRAGKLAELERRLEEAREVERDLPALESEVESLDEQGETLETLLVHGEDDGLVRLRRELLATGFHEPKLRSRGISPWNAGRVLRIEVEATTPQAEVAASVERLTQRSLLVVLEELSIRREDDGATARIRFTARLGVSPDAL